MTLQDLVNEFDEKFNQCTTPEGEQGRCMSCSDAPAIKAFIESYIREIVGELVGEVATKNSSRHNIGRINGRPVQVIHCDKWNEAREALISAARERGLLE